MSVEEGDKRGREGSIARVVRQNAGEKDIHSPSPDGNHEHPPKIQGAYGAVQMRGALTEFLYLRVSLRHSQCVSPPQCSTPHSPLHISDRVVLRSLRVHLDET